MRKWFYILTLLMFAACEEQEIIFTGPYHVRFTEAEETKKESYSKEIEISVHLVGPQRDEDLIINYSVGGSALEDVDYKILGTRGEVTIRRDRSFGMIRLQLINNSNNILESHNIEFVIESVSASDLEIGFGSGVKAGESFTFTILDDCILGGSYMGQNQEGGAPFEDITISSTDCISYILSNWDLEVFNFSDTRNLTFNDNGDNTLTIPEQEEATLITEQATIRGNGVVDPITGEIVLNIELVDFEGSPIVTLIYIPD